MKPTAPEDNRLHPLAVSFTGPVEKLANIFFLVFLLMFPSPAGQARLTKKTNTQVLF